MKNLNKIAIYLLYGVIATVLLFSSCSTDETYEVLGAPAVTFDESSGVYTVKVDKEVKITPTVINVSNPLYTWRMGNKLLSTEKDFTFSSDEIGEYFIFLRVDDENGSTEEEVKIEVLEKTPPQISYNIPESGFIPVVTDVEHKFAPTVKFWEGATYKWILDGKEVGSDSTYIFKQKEFADYKLVVEASTEDGTGRLEMTIRVVESPVLTIEFEKDLLTVPLGRALYINPVISYDSENTLYEWKIDGVVQAGKNASMLDFTPTEQKEYKVTVTGKDGDVTTVKEVTVVCTPAEGEYYRPRTGRSNIFSNKVYEFLPAAGQFVNERYICNTMAEACTYAQDRLNQTQYVSLGGFGGCIVVGFDHSIDNKPDEYDFAIFGNAFAGSSEPGIVWVMQDENGNGLPDDTWYELRGSETGKPETIQNYAVTYYKPTGPEMDVQWVDNQGNSGCVDYLQAFHQQDYYYPNWVKTSSYTLRGTYLKARNYQDASTGYWYNGEYDWGYVDNISTIDSADKNNPNADANANYFKIENAMFPNGSSVDLKYIDFIKVQTGVNTKSGWLGEVSTEVFGFKDKNME